MPSTNSEPRNSTSPWTYVGWGACGCVVVLAIAAAAAWYILSQVAAGLSALQP